MNFFEHQDHAKRLSHWLVFYFLCAVVLIIAAVVAVAGGLMVLTADVETTFGEWLLQPWWMIISLTTLLVIIVGSIWRSHQLREGGDAIAEWAGARRLNMSSRKHNDRQFINVAEEMAIASGVSAPSLWVMENEIGINAFVAGLDPGEAALVVTRGCLTKLDRDQLQGVIAHEFSHIFHGDMRLNVRLMGLLAGITAIGQVGGVMLRSTGAGVSHRRVGAKGYLLVLIGGLALIVVGSVGLFFARLIKASVSRQREYLADASAVQYTRNPQGIAGALAQIESRGLGSVIASAHAEEMSHMCFGETLRSNFFGLFATHPPLVERILRIDPDFEKKQLQKKKRVNKKESKPKSVNYGTSGIAQTMGLTTLSQDVMAVNVAAIVSSIGNPGSAHSEYAHALYEAIPDVALVALHQSSGARLVVMALLMGNAESYYAGREQIIENSEGEKARNQAVQIRDAIRPQIARLRLSILDLAMPQLVAMKREQKDQFLTVIHLIAEIDGKISLFEFMLLTTLKRHLREPESRRKSACIYSYLEVERDIALVLSMVLRSEKESKVGSAEDNKLYATLLRTFTKTKIHRTELPAHSGANFISALEQLRKLSPMLKGPLIESFLDCVVRDGHISVIEAELLRAIAEVLECPLPPLIDMKQTIKQ